MAADLGERRATARNTIDVVHPVDTTVVDDAVARLMRQIAELTRSNEQLTAFTRSAAHDLCGPLAAIAGTAELFARMVGADIEEDAQTVLAALLHNIKKMDRHVHGLLDTARPELDPTGGSVDCDVVVGRVLASLTDLGAAVHRERLGAVYGHHHQLEQIFTKLVLRAARRPSPHVQLRIEITSRPAEGGRIFSVADNGAGVSPCPSAGGVEASDADAPLDEDGASLDLAYCRWAVLGHGGRMWVEPRTGGGTVVSFFLPSSGS